MKYILNETPIRTTENFNINDLKVDIDIPSEFSFHNYVFENESLVSLDSLKKQVFKSKIGLIHDEYQNLEIVIPKDTNLDYKNIVIKYEFQDNDNLIDNIIINGLENSSAVITIVYESKDISSSFHNGNIKISLNDNASLKLNYINLMSKSSINIQSFENEIDSNSKLKVNHFDLSGKLRIIRNDSNTQKSSINELKTVYIGNNKNVIDINYNCVVNEKDSVNKIHVEGVLDGESQKSFKGIIDFLEGSTKSIGDEKENTILLSDDAISKSLPVILCHEEDVVGSHSSSSGKLDDEKVYYLMSRGFSLSDAKKMIIISNFSDAISELDDEYREIITDYIDNLDLHY